MKIPCKDCIIFAICKQKVKSMDRTDITTFSKMGDCDYIKDYIDYLDREFSIPEFVVHINKVRELYGVQLIMSGKDML